MRLLIVPCDVQLLDGHAEAVERALNKPSRSHFSDVLFACVPCQEPAIVFANVSKALMPSFPHSCMMATEICPPGSDPLHSRYARVREAERLVKDAGIGLDFCIENYRYGPRHAVQIWKRHGFEVAVLFVERDSTLWYTETTASEVLGNVTVVEPFVGDSVLTKSCAVAETTEADVFLTDDVAKTQTCVAKT